MIGMLCGVVYTQQVALKKYIYISTNSLSNYSHIAPEDECSPGAVAEPEPLLSPF